MKRDPYIHWSNQLFGLCCLPLSATTVGFYFSTALLIFIYLVNKTTILDFAVSAVFGGIPARLPLSLWFLSFFIMLYYGRNFSPRIMIAIFVVISSFSDPLEIQILKTKQSYHIYLEAELASFPALQKDQSNSLYIKNKIIKYEKDFPQDPLYQAELKIFNISSIKDSSSEELFQIAKKTAKIMTFNIIDFDKFRQQKHF